MWMLHPRFLYGHYSLWIYGSTLCLYMFDINERVYLWKLLRTWIHEVEIPNYRKKLKIARWGDNPNVRKYNFWKLKLEWETLKNENKKLIWLVLCVWKWCCLKNDSLVHRFKSIIKKWTVSYFSRKWHQNDKLNLRMI